VLPLDPPVEPPLVLVPPALPEVPPEVEPPLCEPALVELFAPLVVSFGAPLPVAGSTVVPPEVEPPLFEGLTAPPVPVLVEEVPVPPAGAPFMEGAPAFPEAGSPFADGALLVLPLTPAAVPAPAASVVVVPVSAPELTPVPVVEVSVPSIGVTVTGLGPGTRVPSIFTVVDVPPAAAELPAPVVPEFSGLGVSAHTASGRIEKAMAVRSFLGVFICRKIAPARQSEAQGTPCRWRRKLPDRGLRLYW
jgi:hypothetical protein